jgi:hypothetical protein
MESIISGLLEQRNRAVRKLLVVFAASGFVVLAVAPRENML